MEVQETKNNNSFVLITGGSKGIGKAIAAEFAKRRYNLILVARSIHELSTVSKELEAAYGVIVKYYAIDLSSPLAPKFIYEMVLTDRANVSILVNNAGFGVYGKFSEVTWKEQSLMLQVNINSLVELTYLILPLIKKNSKGYILNVSSTAAFQSLPLLSLYAASKSFVLSFSRGLRLEEKKNNVFVSCICPGPVNTSFMSRANIKEESLISMTAKVGMTAEQVAKVAVKSMFQEKGEVIPGFLNGLTAIAAKILPKGIIEKVTSSILK